jgi:predicted molibdopterin-dependent oxidoreductase YjgC
MSLARLRHPLVKDGSSLRRASGDAALDRAAALLSAAVARRGPGTVGMFACSKATNEVNYMAMKFMRATIGSNHIDSCNRT